MYSSKQKSGGIVSDSMFLDQIQVRANIVGKQMVACLLPRKRNAFVNTFFLSFWVDIFHTSK